MYYATFISKYLVSEILGCSTCFYHIIFRLMAKFSVVLCLRNTHEHLKILQRLFMFSKYCMLRNTMRATK